jgi:hypothetical protein
MSVLLLLVLVSFQIKNEEEEKREQGIKTLL